MLKEGGGGGCWSLKVFTHDFPFTLGKIGCLVVLTPGHIYSSKYDNVILHFSMRFFSHMFLFGKIVGQETNLC